MSISLSKKMILGLVLSFTAPAVASTNRNEVRNQIEYSASEDGYEVIWGDHLSHTDYALCFAGFIVFSDYCITSTLSSAVGSLGWKVVKEVIRGKGEFVEFEDNRYKGKIASFQHWEDSIFGEIDLPNTHQPYIIWRRAD